MKKLLSILTISTLTASVPAPLLANTVQTRVKRDSILTSNSNKPTTNNAKIELFAVWNKTNFPIRSLAVDKDNNIYVWKDDNLFKITSHEELKMVIWWNDENNGWIRSLTVDKNNNTYAGTFSGKLFKSTDGGASFNPVAGWNENNGQVWSLTVDKNSNTYAGTFSGKLF